MASADKVVFEVNETHFDEELTFKDCIKFIQRNFRLLLSGVLVGGVFGLVTALIVPAQWEASALIRVGQLTAAAGASAIVKTPIEPPLQVVDLVKSDSFQNDVLKSLHISISEDNEVAKKFRDSLKVKLEKSDLIELSVRGYSSEMARIYASTVITALKNSHARKSIITLDRLHQSLASNTQQLKEAHIELERITKQLNEMSGSLNEKNFSQTALLSATLLTRTEMVNNLSQLKNTLEICLSPENSYATDILGSVEVSEKPVYPKKPIFAFVGMFLGLVLAILICQLKMLNRSKLS